MSAIAKLIEISSPAFSPSFSGSLENLELENLLKQKNGFFAFEGALKVFSSQYCAYSYTLKDWNSKDLWKYEFGDIADDYFFFAEDIFGGQFGFKESNIYYFEPETGGFSLIANSLEEWAAKILVDYDTLLGYKIAHSWQEKNGQLSTKKRLLPTQPFFMGGKTEVDNLRDVEEVEAMRVRGSMYQQTKDLPNGTQVEIKVIPQIRLFEYRPSMPAGI